MAKVTLEKYKTLNAVVAVNKNRPDRLVAFIDKSLCFFERDIDISSFKEGDVIEVMITRPLHAINPEGHPYSGKINLRALKGLMIVPIDHEKHVMVVSDGFVPVEGTKFFLSNVSLKNKKTLSVKPGRTKPIISKDGVLVPMHVWIKKESLESTEPVEIIGLSRLEDGRLINFNKKFY